MFTIEASGTWGEMGEQVGAAFPGELNACMNRFTPWLTADLDSYRPAIREIRDLLRTVCPDLIEESEGMARGAGMEPELLLGYRFFNEIRVRLSARGP